MIPDTCPPEMISYMQTLGITELYPPQRDAIDAGLLDGNSVMVSAPTASGKTLVAMLAVSALLQRGGRRAVYLSPLRALASEKYAEFKVLKKFLPSLRVSVSAGDLGTAGRLPGNLLCMTNERMDLAFRKQEKWLQEVDLVIADEIHLIGDKYRGATLEMVLAQLRRPDLQIVALSATITNAQELAQWLDCHLVHSEWRPVPLHEGVYNDGMVTMQDNTAYEVHKSSRGPAADLAAQCVRGGGQALIFANTRRGTIPQATKAAGGIKSLLSDTDRMRLAEVSSEILKNQTSGLIRSLADLVKRGVAFHHAGLDQHCRHIVEENFRDGLIKVLAATTTLAAGVNLPARLVIIPNITRYDGNHGRNMPISVLEYKQLCGRAGRPQYDDAGQSVIVANWNTYDDIMTTYIHGTPEPILSHMGDPQSIPSHVLSIIVQKPRITTPEIHDFFSTTLGGRQRDLEYDIDDALYDLEEMRMIRPISDDSYRSTPLGSLTSKLYLRPQTAHDFVRLIRNAGKGDYSLGFLYSMTRCAEFPPLLYLRERDMENACALIDGNRSQLLEEIPYHNASRSLIGLYAWISEVTEDVLSDEYGVESGDIHRMAEAGSWLATCMSRLAIHEGNHSISSQLDSLSVRISYGISKDIVPLVAIRDVGRVRARRLYGAGVRTISDVNRISASQIASICRTGPRTAARIRREAARLS